MRVDCKHYESRTYSDGEVVQKCQLDLAPEAPWRCPDNCSAFEPRLVGAGWVQGSLVPHPPEEEPPAEGVAELLDDAEDIVNAVVPDALDEAEKERRPSWWRRRIGRRRA